MSQRVKIIKDAEQYRKGDTMVVENNTAHRLIEAGIATLTKDMVAMEYKTKKLIRGANNG